MGDEQSHSNHDGLSGEALLQYVGDVAEQLSCDLQQAERLTDGWRDADQTFRLVQAAMRECLDRLVETNCWGEANRFPSSVLWKSAKHWLEIGSLQLHARAKPRGYAGDFQMLEKICTGYLCEHPLGNAFDRFFQSQIAPQAVRNRTTLIADSIVRFVHQRTDAPTHVASIGSGPAIDIERALQQLTTAERHNVRVTLMDMDPAGLEHARDRLEPLLDESQLRCVRENLFRMAERNRSSGRLESVDFLVCSGLFDYLDDRAVVAMLAEFWRLLSPGGQLMVFNFAPGNTSRDYMEWIGNWYLIYRDTDSMMDLARQARLDADSVTVATEDTGADLYWQIRKPE